MGAEPYCYVVDFDADPAKALARLREFVFKEGTYWGAEHQPESPEEALEAAAETGTRSILDISAISEEPDYCCAAPLTPEELERYFGTRTPDADAIDHCEEAWEDLERGKARYYVAYANGAPAGYVFFGYSFD
jgi:hypothetical protein